MLRRKRDRKQKLFRLLRDFMTNKKYWVLICTAWDRKDERITSFVDAYCLDEELLRKILEEFILTLDNLLVRLGYENMYVDAPSIMKSGVAS